MAYAYYSPMYDMDESFPAKAAYDINDDDASRDIYGSGEAGDDEPCKCGCPASETVSWVTALIEGLGAEDQRKTVKMLFTHFRPLMDGNAVSGRAVDGIAVSGRAINGAGRPLMADDEHIFTGGRERTVPVDTSDSVTTSAEADEVDFDFERDFNASEFKQVKITDLSQANDEFIADQPYDSLTEEINFNFDPIEEVVEYDVADLFQIF